jgi:hypothetical protein
VQNMDGKDSKAHAAQSIVVWGAQVAGLWLPAARPATILRPPCASTPIPGLGKLPRLQAGSLRSPEFSLFLSAMTRVCAGQSF